jgi:drug/metabolite transporter (DMT)-like permease
MFVMKPGTSEFHPEMLFALGSAISYAIFQIFTRSLKSDGNLPALITIQHLCYFFSALPLLAFNWSGGLNSTGNMSFDFLLRATVSPTFMEIIYIAICAGTVLFLSLVSSFAYRNVEASLIAPFEYVAIPVSVVWGILIWGDYPSSTAWIGMGLIISSGIYVVYRERLIRLKRLQESQCQGQRGWFRTKKMIKLLIIFHLNNDYQPSFVPEEQNAKMMVYPYRGSCRHHRIILQLEFF